MTSPIWNEHEPPGAERGTDANWSLRDVVIGIAVLLVFRSLSFVSREPLRSVPTWLLVGVAVLLPQLFLLAYPILVSRRRGIGDLFRLPTAGERKLYREPLIAMGVVGGLWIALICVTLILSVVAPRIPLTPEIIERAADSPSLSFVIFIVVAATLVAPICEEVFFRGFLQTALRKRMPIVVAAIVQAFIFGALHTFGTVHAVVVFFLGLVLTAVYEWRKTLLTPILVHAGNNAIAAISYVALVIANAHSPVLGVAGHDDPRGYQIDEVIAGGAAEKAGLAEGDVITKLDAEPVANFQQLIDARQKHRVGDTVTIEVLRDGQPRQIKVVLEKRLASP